MGRQFLMKVAVLVAISLILAGCAAGRGKSAPAYEGEFREFDLYLFALSAGSPEAWELYPGANVDVWAWATEQIKSKATVPGPTLRVREGDTVRINFHDMSSTMAHTIHWHGIHLPWGMDGVPYVSQLPIGNKAFDGHGTLFTYEFKVDQSGTYWYHCHVDTAHHLDMGMYGALIVDPANPAHDPPYDREAILMLDEWDRSHAHQNAAAISSAISKSGDPRVTANDLYAYMRDYVLMNGIYNDTIAGNLRNQPGIRETRDWYPITYAPYFAEYDTYLINGKAFPLTETIFVKSGEILRIRLINAGQQVHAMHLHGHHMYITHKDGFHVPLVRQQGERAAGLDTEDEIANYAMASDTILIGPGERYDVYVYANNPGPWHLHDHIALNEQNDYINPGGMMTMICYEDGWENADLCAEGHKHHLQSRNVTSGSIVMQMNDYLRKLAGLPEPTDHGALPTSSSAPSNTAKVPVPSGGAPATSGQLPLPSVPVQHIH